MAHSTHSQLTDTKFNQDNGSPQDTSRLLQDDISHKQNQQHNAHVIQWENTVLNDFLNEQPVVEQTPVQESKPNIVWHRAFWVNPYINSMRFFCLMMNEPFNLKMVTPVIAKGIHIENVKAGERPYNPFTLKNYTISVCKRLVHGALAIIKMESNGKKKENSTK
ncbi:hypothetical protein [uncultured Shewanella sp.]|uniref:hypothetical protein n=1 Tax=uncultured Shewanella sp. TaxID=173975 RepID=UPI002627ABF0|nr:hypothetical protein [uncultured Shewanella sp.]